MPVARTSQVWPPSSVSQTPPQEMPRKIRLPLLGSTQIEWIPGKSAPPPNHDLRRGSSQSERTSSQDAPESLDRNRPPGKVPHHRTPGCERCPAASDQIISSFQGMALPLIGLVSSTPSGLGG